MAKVFQQFNLVEEKLREKIEQLEKMRQEKKRELSLETIWKALIKLVRQRGCDILCSNVVLDGIPENILVGGEIKEGIPPKGNIKNIFMNSAEQTGLNCFRSGDFYIEEYSQ